MVKLGFLPVTTFASLLGIATILHWNRFNHSHISFYTWAALYFTTPFLVFAVRLYNRTTDPGTVEPKENFLRGNNDVGTDSSCPNVEDYPRSDRMNLSQRRWQA